MTPRGRLWSPPLWLGFLWGVAEGTLFFIVPDIILSWASLSSARNGLRTLCAIVAGSLVAGVLMCGWASWQLESSRAVVASVPFVTPSMFERVRADYLKHGAAGMLKGPVGHGVKGATPDGSERAASGLTQGSPRPAQHLVRSPARKREKHDPARIDPL
jgi:hypothetical protein